MKGKDLLPPKKKEGESKGMSKIRKFLENGHVVTKEEMGY